MKSNLLVLVMSVSILAANGQEARKKDQYLDLGVGYIKSKKIITAGYYHNWYLSKSKKVLKNIFIGTGVRFFGFNGKNVEFTSAIPSLYGTAKEDTLVAPTPYIYSISTFFNFGYSINNKFHIGFDLDVLGISFGPTGNPTYISNGVSIKTNAKPTVLNALLVGANDIGTLVGGLNVRYEVSSKIGIRATYHTIFTELKTENILQTVPEKNSRFRHGFNPIGIGVSYSL